MEIKLIEDWELIHGRRVDFTDFSSTYHFSKFWIHYCKEYHQNIFDLSFQVVDKDNIYAVIPFTKNNNVFSSFDLPLSIYIKKDLASEIKKTASKKIIEHLKKIREDNPQHNWRLSSDTLFLNWLWEESIKIENTLEFVIDLSLDESQIKQNIRKRYHSLINWGKKNLNSIVVDQNNFDENLLKGFHQFHIEVAQRETRSSRSWYLQFEMIKNGNAFAIMSYLNDDLVAASLILLGEKEAFYGVGAYNRELMADNKPLAHWNIFSAIINCKKIGLERFVVGSSSLDEKDPKIKNISKFKKGFTDNPVLKSNLILEDHL